MGAYVAAVNDTMGSADLFRQRGVELLRGAQSIGPSSRSQVRFPWPKPLYAFSSWSLLVCSETSHYYA